MGVKGTLRLREIHWHPPFCGTLGKHMQVNDLWLAGVGTAKAINKQTNKNYIVPTVYYNLYSTAKMQQIEEMYYILIIKKTDGHLLMKSADVAEAKSISWWYKALNKFQNFTRQSVVFYLEKIWNFKVPCTTWICLALPNNCNQGLQVMILNKFKVTDAKMVRNMWCSLYL